MLVAARSPDDGLAGLAFIGADDNNVRIPISTAATISGRMIYPDGKPFVEQSVSCLISVGPARSSLWSRVGRPPSFDAR